MVESRASFATSCQNPAAVVVEYAEVPGALCVRVMASGRVHSLGLACRPAEVGRELAELHALFEDYPSAEIRREMRARLATLYDWLIAPLSGWLPSASPLVILPSEALAGVPFAALFDRREERFLLEDRLVVLVTALQMTGAPPTIGSLWPVDDECTSRLFAGFHDRLERGDPPDVALREAQLYLADSGDPELASPGTWAAFALSGESFPWGTEFFKSAPAGLSTSERRWSWSSRQRRLP
ncbi:MAG TPA: CHAT domain-containing protein [Thermoanaerobaculia bacterium]|nr:CHAT domain-containing protein [Thermoanaerobaculia bacterium]